MHSLITKVETRLLHTALNAPPGVQRLLAGRPVVIDGQTLAAEVQLMLRLEKLTHQPEVGNLPVSKGRRVLRRHAQMLGGQQRIGSVRELVVTGAEGALPSRLYTPTSRLEDSSAPTLLFFHGGGFIYGDLDSHDAACRHLAEHSGVNVLAVDYRLAPEHPFPAPADDAIAALRWLLSNVEAVGADPLRIAVGGDSAGANLAAVTALQAADEGLPLAFQLLIYPAVDFAGETRSGQLFGNGFYLTDAFRAAANNGYFANVEQRADPAASVLRRSDFPKRIAPAHVVTAGFDPLRDEGEAYAQLLAEHGVTVDARRYPSMIHSFFNSVGCGHEGPANNREIAERLRQALR